MKQGQFALLCGLLLFWGCSQSKLKNDLIGKSYKNLNDIGIDAVQLDEVQLPSENGELFLNTLYAQDSLFFIVLEKVTPLPSGGNQFQALDVLELVLAKEQEAIGLGDCRLNEEANPALIGIFPYGFEEEETEVSAVRAWKSNLETGKIESISELGVKLYRQGY